MEISSELLKILVCPVSNSSLIYDRDASELISVDAAMAYPVIEGIPMLLVGEARQMTSEELKKYKLSDSAA
jgi:uncharacterized protein YbaR (Trm112 family)